MPTANPTLMDRRQFLINTGWTAIGVTALAACSPIYSALPALPSTDNPEWADAVTWIQVLPTGKVRFYCPRMEMGQGAAVGLSQVVAEELNVSPNGIECVLPNTRQIPRFKMTVGSESIAEFFEPVSRAAAGVRETLRRIASEQTKLHPSKIKDTHSGFALPDGRRLGYGMLLKDSPMVLTEEKMAIVEGAAHRYVKKNKSHFRAIGNSWKHHDLEAMVTGKPLFARDASVPGMLYGQVLKPPAFGSRLIDADGKSAEKTPGVIAVMIDKKHDFAGIVVQHPSQLAPALERIKVTWSRPDKLSQASIDERLNVERILQQDQFEHTLISRGNAGSKTTKSRRRVQGLFKTPFAVHAAMEPRAAIVFVKQEGVEVWCGSQDPFFVQRRVAKTIGRPASAVLVHPHRMGGAFGGRVPCQASEEAARLSQAVGRPVRVEWDRETEFASNYFQPGFSHLISAGVTEDGMIETWEHDFVSAPIITGLVPDNIAWLLDRMMADEGTARGGMPPYRIENLRIRYSDIRTPIPIGAWRGLGAAPNAFAIESMIDDLANSAGIDPLAFRLKNLDSTQRRLARVLKHVSKLADWGRTLPSDTGHGIAAAIYKNQTHVAVIAEVKIDPTAKKIRVQKIWCVQDCGLVINPDQVENQIAGNIVWGCGMALKEQVTFEAGAVEQRNFDDYELMRHDDTPEMTIELLPSDAAPTAVGESAFAPVAPAIANAVFAATGIRVNQLPINPDSIFKGQGK